MIGSVLLYGCEQLPALFEGHFKELDQPGAFDDGQPFDGDGRFQQGEGFLELGQPLAPSDILAIHA